MNRKVILGLGFAMVSAAALAQVGAPPTSSPPSTTPPGTTPATPDASGSLGGTATTPAGEASGSGSFSTADMNADGKISRAEARSDVALSAKFKDLDSDRDGLLSMSEYATYGTSLPVP